MCRCIETARDVLVVGSDIIEDFVGVGPKIIERLRDGIRARFPILRLLRSPTPAYATVFCRDLSEVPIVAVYDRLMQPGPRASLQDVLDRSEIAQSRFLFSDAFERFFIRAVKFAKEFNQEKQNSSLRLIQ